MPKKLLILFALSCYSLLIGCGTKGPLYIPEQRYPQKTQQDEPTKAPPSTTDKQPAKE